MTDIICDTIKDDARRYLPTNPDVKEWLKEYIDGKWQILNDGENNVVWVFEKEEDAMAFKLTWT